MLLAMGKKTLTEEEWMAVKIASIRGFAATTLAEEYGIRRNTQPYL